MFEDFLATIILMLFHQDNLDKKLISISLLDKILETQPHLVNNKRIYEELIPSFFDNNLHEDLVANLKIILSFWLTQKPSL